MPYISRALHCLTLTFINDHPHLKLFCQNLLSFLSSHRGRTPTLFVFYAIFLPSGHSWRQIWRGTWRCISDAKFDVKPHFKRSYKVTIPDRQGVSAPANFKQPRRSRQCSLPFRKPALLRHLCSARGNSWKFKTVWFRASATLPPPGRAGDVCVKVGKTEVTIRKTEGREKKKDREEEGRPKKRENLKNWNFRGFRPR